MKNHKTKKRFFLFCLLILSGFFSESLFSAQEDIEISPLKDAILLSSGVALSLTALALDYTVPYPPLSHPSLSEINFFDKLAVFPYSPAFDWTGQAFFGLTVLNAGLFFFAAEQTEWLKIATIYTETLLISNGVKDMLKFIVKRPRPYIYFENVPQTLIAEQDYNYSFPSGHTTLAFSAATLNSVLFYHYQPDSPWLIPFISLNYSFAVLTAVFRVTGGEHFLTDVLAGAALGSFIGWLIPAMHMNQPWLKKSESGSLNSTRTKAINRDFNIELDLFNALFYFEA